MQLRLQPIELVARQVGPLVDDDVAHLLAAPARDAARLAVVQREALVQREAADARLDAIGRAPQAGVAGQHDVVGIARVARAQLAREAGDAQVQAERAEICKRR